MKAFQFAPGLDLRVIDRDGASWFVAKDVCEVLGLKPDATNGSLQGHIRRLDADEWVTAPLPSVSGTRKQYLISESGLYSLILTSRKPEAKAFKRWVTSEVLPAIRKNGGYMAPAVAKLAVESPAEFMARVSCRCLCEVRRHLRKQDGGVFDRLHRRLYFIERPMVVDHCAHTAPGLMPRHLVHGAVTKPRSAHQGAHRVAEVVERWEPRSV